MRLAFATAFLFLVGTLTGVAAPGPEFREHLAGFIFPDPTDVTTRKSIDLNLHCFEQDPGERFCSGTYRCHRAHPVSGFPPPPPRCTETSGTIGLGFNDLDATCLRSALADSGLAEVVFSARFPDGVVCQFDGLSQHLLSIRSGITPAIQGRYECTDAMGTRIEGGVFSVRLMSFRHIAF